MADVFISYSRDDAGYAHKIAESVEQMGLSVKCEIPLDDDLPSDVRKYAVYQHLNGSRAIIPIISKSARHSNLLKLQLLYAEVTEKLVFPVILEKKVWKQVDNLDYVQVEDDNLPPISFFEKLLASIEVIRHQEIRQAAIIPHLVDQDLSPLTIGFLHEATTKYTRTLLSEGISSLSMYVQIVAALKVMESLYNGWLDAYSLRTQAGQFTSKDNEIVKWKGEVQALHMKVLSMMDDELDKILNDVPLPNISDKERAKMWVKQGLIDSVDEVYEELSPKQEQRRLDNIERFQERMARRNRSDDVLVEAPLYYPTKPTIER